MSQRRLRNRGCRCAAEALEARRLLSGDEPTPMYDLGVPVDPEAPQGYIIGGRWSSTATNSSTGSTGTGITLTWSIVPDGTLMGTNSQIPKETNSPSILRARLDALYGSSATWLPLFQQMFD